MAGLFASGYIVDLILAIVVVEAAALVALRRFRPAWPPLRNLLVNLLAGFFLLLALRAAIAGLAWGWIAACLAAAGLAHAADLARRLRR